MNEVATRARRGLARPTVAAAALLLLALGGAQAATLTVGLLTRAEDERLDKQRLALAYLGQPQGTLEAAMEVARDESSFELDAAKLEVRFEVVEVKDAADAKAALAKLEQDKAVAALVDLPADWLAGIAPQAKLPLLNAGEADDGLRALCAPNLFHTLPSERMRADALSQSLMARRWQKVLVLQGPSPADAARGAVVQASIKRYGLKPVAVKPYKLSADPRERALGNPLLLTATTGGTGDYDAVWVVDSDGEFARGLNYRTALPRPVVGDGGLFALGWGPNSERFGAPQLDNRFKRAAKRPMTDRDWAAWMATKAILQAALEKPAQAGPAQVRAAMVRADFNLDGFKGSRLSFRAWDRQLRQALMLTDGQGVIGMAPAEGVLHPTNVLDTLGVDAPESKCKP